MKELSIEEKSKRYEKALDEAKAIHKAIRKDLKPVIEQIFPELIETEDERIRKEITDFIRRKFENSCSPTPSKTTLANWITWLEQQGEKKPGEDSLTLEEFENAFITKAKQYDIDLPNRSWDIHALCKELYSLKHKPKQGEQNPADKVEPKFHEGDWLVTDKGDTVQIGIVNNDYYTIGNGMLFNMSYVDTCWHLWTIEDAKDGDVLRLGYVIAIFKKYIGQNNCICYCSYVKGVGFEVPIKNGEDNVYGCRNTTPASKEERDLLFQKMKEADYEWDANKKELKKL